MESAFGDGDRLGQDGLLTLTLPALLVSLRESVAQFEQFLPQGADGALAGQALMAF
ncbi:hypothetical protein QBC31_41445 [Streptomyces sp. B21-079]|uniref:hypothetical protein n=1 Tax=Streptomyces sp. B21-079 TaxID=3039409 RepID=UPI002FEF0343